MLAKDFIKEFPCNKRYVVKAKNMGGGILISENDSMCLECSYTIN